MSTNINTNKYYDEALAYYLFLELGSKNDFDKEIKEHGSDYISYYYDESYEDSNYQSKRGNVYIPVAV
jgi:hypothetical protein